MRLLEEILFFSKGFSLFATSKFSRLRFRLSVKMSIQFFLPIFVFGYFCSVDACVVCIVYGGCKQSSSALFYVVS